MYVATRYVTILPDDANYPRYGGPETVVSAAEARRSRVSRYSPTDIPHRARRGRIWTLGRAGGSVGCRSSSNRVKLKVT